LSLAVQELTDIVRVVILLTLSGDTELRKDVLKRQIDNICARYVCIEMSDLDRTITGMSSEGLVLINGDLVKLTDNGIRLGREWRSLLLKKEPILEIVAGLADGSVTGLVVVLSAFISGLYFKATVFAALLTLAAVSLTNFSSFLLGGITEDLADMTTLQNLMNYSLSDISDRAERSKSLNLVMQLFTILHKEISRSNLYAATISGVTTFLAGSLPIVAYLTLPEPLGIILSLCIVGSVVGIFLVRYRAKRTRVHWSITLLETIVIVTIAVLASLLVGVSM